MCAEPIFAHELGAQRRKGRRVVNVYVLSLLFLKLIVVKRGLAHPCKKEERGVCGRGRALYISLQSRGPADGGAAATQTLHEICAQLNQRCKTGQKRKMVNGRSSE